MLGGIVGTMRWAEWDAHNGRRCSGHFQPNSPQDLAVLCNHCCRREGGAIDLQFLCNEEYIVCSKNISNKQYTLCSKNTSNAHTHRPTHGPTGIPYGRHRKHNNNTHKYTYTQEHIHRHIDTGTPIECSTCNLQGTLWKVTSTFVMVDSLPSSKVCSNTFCSAHQAQHHPRAPPMEGS